MTEINTAESLVQATQSGKLERVNDILQSGSINVDAEYKTETALSAAAKDGCMDICRLLFSHGADCNKSVNDKTPLWTAAYHGHKDILKAMLATRKCSRENINRTFLLCAELSRVDMCRCLLEAGASVNYTGESPHSHHRETAYAKPAAIHYAVDGEEEELVKLLINYGANVNAIAGNLQKTPLHLAVGNESVEILDLLLSVPNISPNVVDSEYNTPLTAAIKLHKKNCVRVFLKHSVWMECMSVKMTGDHNKMETPMRLMIRQMPDVAAECMDECIELNYHRDSKNRNFKARFFFGFLDDAFSSTNWINAKPKLALPGTRMSTRVLDISSRPKEVADRGKEVKGPKKRRSAIAYHHWATRIDPSLIADEEKLHCDTECFDCQPGITTSRCRVKDEVEPYCVNAWSMKANHCLMIADMEKANYILCHPLSVALINYKWHKAGRFYCYGRLLVTFCYVCILTAQVFDHREHLRDRAGAAKNGTTSESNGQPHRLQSIDVILAILTLLFLGKEVFALYSQPRVYLSRLGNFSDLFLYSSVIALIIVGLISWHVPVALSSACVFLAWFNTALTLRKFPVIGIFFVMFIKILRNSTIVLVIFFPILFGFSVTFSILLNNSSPLFTKENAIATVLVMLSGEVEYADSMDNAEKANVNGVITVYVLFIVVMVICLLNLLVGIAVSDVEKLRDEAESEMMTLKAEEVLSCEFYLPQCLRRKFARGCLTIHPNRTAHFHGKESPNSLINIIKRWCNIVDFVDKRLSAEKLLEIKSKKLDENNVLRCNIDRLENKMDKRLDQIENRLASLLPQEDMKSGEIHTEALGQRS